MPRTFSLFSIANYIMAALFTFAAVVQYNDPDSIRWIIAYGAAALACLVWSSRSIMRWMHVVVLSVCLIYIILLITEMDGSTFRAADVIESFEMKNESVELFREIGGLVVISVWMSVLFIKKRTENYKLGENS